MSGDENDLEGPLHNNFEGLINDVTDELGGGVGQAFLTEMAEQFARFKRGDIDTSARRAAIDQLSAEANDLLSTMSAMTVATMASEQRGDYEETIIGLVTMEKWKGQLTPEQWELIFRGASVMAANQSLKHMGFAGDAAGFLDYVKREGKSPCDCPQLHDGRVAHRENP